MNSMWLIDFIKKYRRKRHEKLDLEVFLRYGTNMDLKDKINNYPRPDKSLLRILGNGDSLKSVVSQLSDSCDYMVMNCHVLHESYYQIKPRYYVLADPCFFTPNKNSDETETVKRILSTTKWPMTLFIPWEHTRHVDIKSTEYVHVEIINQSLYHGAEQYREYCYEHNLAMPNVENVLISSIYLAIYMGYPQVELYGVEHSWTRDLYVNNNNHTCIRDSHFYDTEQVDDREICDSVDGHYLKFHEVLQMYMNYFPSYWELRDLADRHHCRIVNMTQNSYIDAFERGTDK